MNEREDNRTSDNVNNTVSINSIEFWNDQFSMGAKKLVIKI